MRKPNTGSENTENGDTNNGTTGSTQEQEKPKSADNSLSSLKISSGHLQSSRISSIA